MKKSNTQLQTNNHTKKQYTTLGPSLYFRKVLAAARRPEHRFQFWQMISKTLVETRRLNMASSRFGQCSKKRNVRFAAPKSRTNRFLLSEADLVSAAAALAAAIAAALAATFFPNWKTNWRNSSIKAFAHMPGPGVRPQVLTCAQMQFEKNAADDAPAQPNIITNRILVQIEYG